jgi:hypothetical protein
MQWNEVKVQINTVQEEVTISNTCFELKTMQYFVHSLHMGFVWLSEEMTSLALNIIKCMMSVKEM